MLRNFSDPFNTVWNLTYDLLQSFELENTTALINYSNNSTIVHNFSVSIINNSNGTSDVSKSIDLPWWANTIWSIVFGLLIAVAVGGNLIVIWIVFGKSPHTYKCYTIFTLTNMIFEVITIILYFREGLLLL